MKKFLRVTTVSVIFVAAPFLIVALAGADPQAPATPITANEWETPVAITTVPTTPNGATRPYVDAAPDGRVMVVFNVQLSADANNKDPYFSESTNMGETWTPPARIFNSPGTGSNSLQVHFDFDASSTAHAVWVENDGTVLYAGESAWPNSAAELYQAGFADKPQIVASGANTLDVVWSNSSNLFHARSINGGASWITDTISFPGSTPIIFPLKPALFVDKEDMIHLAWEDIGTVYYSQGTAGGTSWTEPVAASTASSNQDAREAQVGVISGEVHLSYSIFVDKDTQFVHHVQCSDECTDLGNWVSTSNPISGQVLGVNPTQPFNVFSSLLPYRGCTLLYFHGTSSDFVEDKNAVVWGVNDCTGWSAAARDQVTAPTTQSVFPDLGTDGWWLYLAYEQRLVSTSQIYATRTKPDLHVPVMVVPK